MVDHVVIFKIKKDTPSEKVNAMTEALNNLKSVIPQLLDIHAGINFSARNKDYSVMLVSRFRNKEDLVVYANHPAHKKVVEENIQPIREDLIVGDLEY